MGHAGNCVKKGDNCRGAIRTMKESRSDRKIQGDWHEGVVTSYGV